jgi:uncharacterized protein
MFLLPIDTLQVVFKIAERCNINCTYCYYFNMGEDSALRRPATVSVDTTEIIAEAIERGCQDLGIRDVRISFHGGEPMMVSPRRFESICRVLCERISPVAKLRLSMQTNGTVSVDKWIETFNRYKVAVSFSIDGDREAHDRYRLSKNSLSTFAITENNLKKMIHAAQQGRCIKPATISVLDTANRYGDVYRYLRALGIEQMTFLLPDRNANDSASFGGNAARQFGQALLDIFRAWLEEDNPNVRIRHIDRVMRLLRPLADRAAETCSDADMPRNGRHGRHQIIMARSDGTLAVNDSYIPALSWYETTPVYSVFDKTLKAFLSHAVFEEIETIEKTLPAECRTCKWKHICRGGDLENRYSDEASFDNKSVYCESYKVFLQGMYDLMVANGLPARMFPLAHTSVGIHKGNVRAKAALLDTVPVASGIRMSTGHFGTGHP